MTLMGNSMGSFSSVYDDEQEWVVVMKQSGKTQETVHNICQAASNCTAEEQALGMTVVHGTGRELEGLIAQDPDAIQSLELDAPCEAIPELEGDPSLLEAGQVESWGLDRIDARAGLDNSYDAPADGGAGVHVYVTDTGVKVSHNDFGGRAIPTLEILGSTTRVCQEGSTNCSNDVHGHGTHCAGTVGGTQYGVAKGVTIHGVKTLSNSGGGQFSWWTRAVDWIVQNGLRPAVVSASLGGRGTHSFVGTAIERAVEAGVTG